MGEGGDMDFELAEGKGVAGFGVGEGDGVGDRGSRLEEEGG